METETELYVCPYCQARFPERLATIERALAESLKLQSHYAEILNMRDGGERMQFLTVEAWLERLRSLKILRLPPLDPPCNPDGSPSPAPPT